MTGKKRSVEALWRDLFSNASQWWDHRPEKINPRFPDFKHKQSEESLWVSDARNPPWVQAELAALPPGVLQCNVFTWTRRLRKLVKARQYKRTMEVFHQMQQERICPDSWTFLPVLNACAGLGALEDGRDVHQQIKQAGCASDGYVANCLVDMYAKCGSIEDAWTVFNEMQDHNVVTWNAMIGGHVKSRRELKAMELFWKMQQEGVKPDAVTFMGVLNACAAVAALAEGRRVHEQIIQSGYESDVYVATCLVNMYAKCWSIEDAWSVFNKMQHHDIVTWNAMVGGYVKSGQGLKAMDLFRQMQQEGIEPDAITFVGVLNACASVAALDEGRRVHKKIIQTGCESDICVGNCLVDMYAKCGSIDDAWAMFTSMKEHNVITWNTMIGGYAKSGRELKAMELFWKMQQEGVEPDTITFVGMLNACASIVALEQGRSVHEQIIRRGSESNVYVATCLIDMYAKCGSIEDAWSIFDKMQGHNVVTWNVMVRGYVRSGQGRKAIELFQKMLQEGLEPNAVTFVQILNACASVTALEEGRRVHEQIVQVGCQSDAFVATCLVDMYAKCGSIDDALSVFNEMQEQDIVAWNAMIGGYVKSGHELEAMELFQNMQQAGLEPDDVTYVGVLNACASLAALEQGRRVHEHIIQNGCESNTYVATCLVDMYAKCGSIEDAWSVFDKMQEQNVTSWNAMIGGYVKSGQGLRAIELYWKMQQEGMEPNAVTFVAVLNACASVAALKEGRHVHGQIIQRCCDSNIYVANCLVDMYAKCGSIEDAWVVFNKMQEHNIVTWNAMIWGYAMHGQAAKAIELFRRMGKEVVEINEITFTCLLSACRHGGLVKEGLRYFKFMSSSFNIVPSVENYACIVDLLGRAGKLEEAEELIKRTQLETDVSAWRSLLGGCRIHGNIEIAERAAKWCRDLDPRDASGYVLLSNAYAAAGKWDRSAAIQAERLETEVWKEPGCTWIKVNNFLHSFVEDKKEHPRILEVCAELDRLLVQMDEAGYVQDMTFALYGEKIGSSLCCHSKKLATEYEVISTTRGTPLNIKKNLPLCYDDHDSTKFITNMLGRVLTV